MDIVWPIMVKRGHNLFYGPTSEIYFIYFLFGLVTCHQPDYDYGFYVQFCYIIFTFNIIYFYRHLVQRGSMAAEVWQFAAIVVLKGCLFVKRSRSIIKKSKWSPVPECSIHPWSIRTEHRLSFQTLSPSLQTTRVEEHGLDKYIYANFEYAFSKTKEKQWCTTVNCGIFFAVLNTVSILDTVGGHSPVKPALGGLGVGSGPVLRPESNRRPVPSGWRPGQDAPALVSASLYSELWCSSSTTPSWCAWSAPPHSTSPPPSAAASG